MTLTKRTKCKHDGAKEAKEEEKKNDMKLNSRMESRNYAYIQHRAHSVRQTDTQRTIMAGSVNACEPPEMKWEKKRKKKNTTQK